MVDFAFLDSGTGGIPYMLALKEKQPQARCVYLGDTLNFPYGEKSFEEITECSSQAISQIVSHWNPRTVIIACNTISVTALEQLRVKFPDLPIIGTVPAIKLAAKVTSNKKIGFLATNASVNHPYSQKLIDDFARDCQVYRRGDPDLIAFIEKNLFTATEEEKLAAVKPSVDYFSSLDCDVIILGCTHFTHVAEIMQKAAGNRIKVIDSRDGVSNQAIRVEESAMAVQIKTNHTDDVRDCSFYVTSATESEEAEYKILCKSLNIPWGGILKQDYNL